MEKKGGDAGGFSGDKNPEPAAISDPDKADVDFFYEKVCKLNESSGLSLVFNFRETMLDLHRFYKEVIKRGGFYQVTKMGKWDDVASASNLNSSMTISAAQLQKAYELLVLQYELMYSRKMPDQANIWPNKNSLGTFYTEARPSSSTGKRKQSDSSAPFPTIRCGDTCQTITGPKVEQKNAKKKILPKSNTEESIMAAPLKPRTGYHIFLRLETHRSKMILGESSSSINLRQKAALAWKALPEEEKLPYIEASKMDKERYEMEMAAYKQQQENQNAKSPTLFNNTTSSMINFATPSDNDDVYHVSLEKESGNVRPPDESMVELAKETMKNAESNDSIFQTDLDSGSQDVPP
ncbi:hypothetical protein ACS0TY_005545 [Phlomoides rotata]